MTNRWFTFMVIVSILLTGCSFISKQDESPVNATPIPEDDRVGSTVSPTLPVSGDDLDQSEKPIADPYAHISTKELLSTLSDLTAIQPYSGWRNSATEGEVEALDYMTSRLEQMPNLQSMNIELERQNFRVFLSTELWQADLNLMINGQEIAVPASGLRGPRDDIQQARRFDSDGNFNDSDRNPITVDGPTILVRTQEEIEKLDTDDVSGKIVFLDYQAVDQSLLGTNKAVGIAWKLMEKHPIGLVLVTENSFEPGQSHGTFIGDGSALRWVEVKPAPPIIYVRLEDLAPAGIKDWRDLSKIKKANMTWDADVFIPGYSGNLVAHIPGQDASRAMILGAHIDSPNCPGAMDDGSGSAILLEIARILDETRTQPPIDLYLVWFGSEEIGLYGSSYFAATHQDLLDRSLAMLQIDMLSRPLDGIDASINLVQWPYGRLGDDRMLWPLYLDEIGGERGIDVLPVDYYGIESDNSSFNGFNLPNANMIFMNGPEMEKFGPLHYAAHIHDPYDTVEMATQVSEPFAEMARLALAAVLETGKDSPALRIPPDPSYQALFVGSHTESAHMAPTAFIDLGMAMAMEGYDVDLMPYGEAVTPANLEGIELVIALPVVDYPTSGADPDLYDESWSEQEIAALETYVREGGFLVLTNSAHRLKYGNIVLDENEDWSDMNALASPFGVTYRDGIVTGATAQLIGDHSLVKGKDEIHLADSNGIPFDSSSGTILAESGGKPIAVLIDHGNNGGQVLALADVGILGATWEEPANLFFWQNLSRYAKTP